MERRSEDPGQPRALPGPRAGRDPERGGQAGRGRGGRRPAQPGHRQERAERAPGPPPDRLRHRAQEPVPDRGGRGRRRRIPRHRAGGTLQGTRAAHGREADQGRQGDAAGRAAHLGGGPDGDPRDRREDGRPPHGPGPPDPGGAGRGHPRRPPRFRSRQRTRPRAWASPCWRASQRRRPPPAPEEAARTEGVLPPEDTEEERRGAGRAIRPRRARSAPEQAAGGETEQADGENSPERSANEGREAGA